MSLALPLVAVASRSLLAKQVSETSGGAPRADQPAATENSDATLARFQDASRKQAWELGRHLIKNTINNVLTTEEGARVGQHQRELYVCTRNGLGRGIRPTVFANGSAVDLSMSLSHTDDLIAFGVADSTSPIGIDVVSSDDTERLQQQLELWFTRNERDLLRDQPDNVNAAVIWGLKEATFKAVNVGETFRPRHWECTFREGKLNVGRRGQTFSLARIESRVVSGNTIVGVTIADQRRTSGSNGSPFSWSITA